MWQIDGREDNTPYPGRSLYSIPKVDREVNMEYKKSAEVVVVKRVSEN